MVIGVLGGLNWLETVELVKEIPNLYLDLASSFVSLAPRLAAAEVPERCLFGSNTPFADMYSNRVLVERMVPDPAVRARVMGENLAELLGLVSLTARASRGGGGRGTHPVRPRRRVGPVVLHSPPRVLPL